MPLGRRQWELTWEVGQWLEGCACPLVHLGACLGGEPRALLDQGQRGIRLELAGAQPLGGVLEPRRELNQSIGHVRETISPLFGLSVRLIKPAHGSLEPKQCSDPLERAEIRMMTGDHHLRILSQRRLDHALAQVVVLAQLAAVGWATAARPQREQTRSSGIASPGDQSQAPGEGPRPGVALTLDRRLGPAHRTTAAADPGRQTV